MTPPSPPAEKATARQDQAGKASADDGAGDGELASDFANGEWDIVNVRVSEPSITIECHDAILGVANVK